MWIVGLLCAGQDNVRIRIALRVLVEWCCGVEGVVLCGVDVFVGLRCAVCWFAGWRVGGSSGVVCDVGVYVVWE